MRLWGATVIALVTVATDRIDLAVADPSASADSSASHQVEVLAYGFPGIDERDLGVMFTADLKRLDGSPRLFEKKPAKRVPRREIDKHLLRSWDHSQIDAGVDFLFVGLGVTQTESRDVVVFDSHEVEDVRTLDDSAQVIEKNPPQDAAFYLAEVHVGSCVDMMIEADYSETGAKLDLLFPSGEGDASAQDVKAHGNYDVRIKGLGVKDVTGQGVFAMKLSDIARNYRAVPAPIVLVFRTIPGRTYQREQNTPQRVVDAPRFTLADGKSKTWSVPEGLYRVVAASSPNGFGVGWAGDVRCDQTPAKENRTLTMTCRVNGTATLRIANPPIAHDIADELGGSPDETMSLYLGRLALKKTAKSSSAAEPASTGLAEAMKKMRDYKEKMCSCADAACAQDVAEDMTRWSQAMAKDQKRPAKATEDDTKQMAEITKAMTDCMTRAMSGGANDSSRGAEQQPDLDRSIISIAMDRVKASALKCGEWSSAKGVVKIRVNVSASGKVSDVTVVESPDAALGACVAAAALKASFPQTHRGGAFTYPFSF